MTTATALLALAIEASAGYPDPLFRRVGHPVTWAGALISALDKRLNLEGDSFALRRAKGIAALVALAATALVAGSLIDSVALSLPYGWIALAVLSSSLLAQRSLYAHVADVARGLSRSLDDGRQEVGKIVGRDVSLLDEAGVARAAIESLAENFSDGVVAPALFLALFGLPGALLYKAVNTADSMIGHRSPRYLAFGWAAARCDDVFNLIPARMAAGLIVAAAWATGASAQGAYETALRDASKHASPNAGWPEAAMAGALGLSLGGPRSYHELEISGATLGTGRREATADDIFRGLTIYKAALAVLWLIIVVGALAGAR
ncbi:adenosylcobinamide-phosphate synthase CbiB [Methylocystis sp. MJC1]|jgi:adenosylcobinamide-phosphate synthase|uniref:adenosylcobinamide-phosphate synthase CbiB n=1 Tax=Methylocystis sp. MJC1 TaxID=2654282 RepID=UPI0013EB5C29|nr:adenosylcobinamide-phosphate synthase CbiB [Methylocystis sp. MJC1]KAF2990422.1 Cobalamin biosynthesis protein CobD [Methylocystis sp. MJC1]MBU6528217.1 cobalamin biosynthesis protein CobD [Methylocystis sp. MJC1]UZX11126.1 adenosylcobinamide-phosphate synthase CbiB [Methylocystis sp. MJC1]